MVTLLFEASGFHLEKNYEETLNQYFLENPDDELLLELEFVSSDLEKSRSMLGKGLRNNTRKYDGNKFTSIICEQLEENYENFNYFRVQI